MSPYNPGQPDEESLLLGLLPPHATMGRTYQEQDLPVSGNANQELRSTSGSEYDSVTDLLPPSPHVLVVTGRYSAVIVESDGTTVCRYHVPMGNSGVNVSMFSLSCFSALFASN